MIVEVSCMMFDVHAVMLSVADGLVLMKWQVAVIRG